MNDYECRMLLSKFSHEVRNPLALINSFLQLLIRDYPKIASCTYYNKIVENMRLLRQLLDEMSHFNNAGRIHPEPADISRLIRDAASSAESILSARQIVLRLEFQEPLPQVRIDHGKMLQVFYNLFRNAEEAMPEGGLITVSATAAKENGGILISVKDDGPSIPKEFLPTLFDPLVTHKSDGTGLGLAICREIVSAHGGTIAASPDGSPVFTIFLPSI